MVGRGGLEPPTSRLSGVRSNHLSYRPLPLLPARGTKAGPRQAISRKKGHEDGGNVKVRPGNIRENVHPDTDP